MKLSAAVIAAAATLAAAQSPSCALPCLPEAIKSANTGCGSTDVSCLCRPENMSKVEQAGRSCLANKCSAEETEQPLNFAKSLC
ncbi:hypothetical protein PWT90_05188 [Aphanocladium album]|nr:hypothetical protein PWT90_05188 [Aphanocladium album]